MKKRLQNEVLTTSARDTDPQKRNFIAFAHINKTRKRNVLAQFNVTRMSYSRSLSILSVLFCFTDQLCAANFYPLPMFTCSRLKLNWTNQLNSSTHRCNDNFSSSDLFSHSPRLLLRSQILVVANRTFLFESRRPHDLAILTLTRIDHQALR
jgi:hypothetical protein